MAYILNPKYNPNDPKSQRYISDPLTLPGTQQTPAPNMSVPAKPAPTLPAMDLGITQPKTSTPAITPKIAVPTTPTPNMTPAPNMSVNKPAMSVATPTAGGSYTIKGGDNLSKIAAANGTSVAELMRLNPQIKNANVIQAGQSLKLPGKVLQNSSTTQPATGGMSVGSSIAPPTAPVAPTVPQADNSQGGGITLPNDDTTGGAGAPPPTGNAKTDASMAELAKQAGKAGMSLKDYLDMINGTNGPTKEQQDKIRNDLGIPDLVKKAYDLPAQSTTDLYKSLYDMGGMQDIKASVKKLDDEIAQKRADLVTATGELLNNPWISQASRSGRLGNLNRIAMADIQNSIDQKQQYLDQYDKGITEIEKQIKNVQFDQGLDRDLSVDKLNYLLTQAEGDEKLVKREMDQKNLRYVPDFLAGQSDVPGEGFTLSEGQTRYDAQGNALATNSGGSGGNNVVKINGVDYIDNGDGTYSNPTLPSAPVNPAVVQSLDDKIGLIDSIMNSDVLDSLVGPTGFFNRAYNPFSLGEQQGLQGSIHQLVDKATLDQLTELKKQGGTLGAISEKELTILQNAATKIAGWETEPGSGKYAVGEAQFKAELQKLKDSAQRLKNAVGGKNTVTLNEHYKSVNDVEKERIKRIIADNPDLDEGEVMSLLGFNPESQTSSKGSIEDLKKSIIQQESRGDYKAVGIPTSSGVALGKYQIIPMYHFAKIGLNPNSEADKQKFLNSPALQDKLFGVIIEGLNTQYGGDYKKIAAAYYGGGGGVSKLGTPAANQRYQGGKSPSINEYVNQVLSRLA